MSKVPEKIESDCEGVYRTRIKYPSYDEADYIEAKRIEEKLDLVMEKVNEIIDYLDDLKNDEADY